LCKRKERKRRRGCLKDEAIDFYILITTQEFTGCEVGQTIVGVLIGVLVHLQDSCMDPWNHDRGRQDEKNACGKRLSSTLAS
jgi:hypothetical protein